MSEYTGILEKFKFGFSLKTFSTVISLSSAITTVRGVIISDIVTSSSDSEFAMRSRSCGDMSPSFWPFSASIIISSSLRSRIWRFLRVIFPIIQNENFEAGFIIILSQCRGYTSHGCIAGL